MSSWSLWETVSTTRQLFISDRHYMEGTRQLSEAVLFEPPHAHLPFKSATVLGAGTMGAQIAAHLANAGLNVYLLDIPPRDGGNKDAVVERGFAQARKAKPDPFFTDEAARRITTGNFDDDFERVSQSDWVIEAVVERLDVKRGLMERIEAAARPDTIISTNTSGLSVADIAEGRSESFRRRFLATHFFNPPRYLKLLELVPSRDTDVSVLQRIAHFGRIHLGKGIVIAKDTPYFIGNRIGVFAMLQAMRKFTDEGYTIEEVDTLTGTVVGRPKSATFRTADVVGLDVMKDVADNLYGAVPEDTEREAFRMPEIINRLVERGSLGQKSGTGFYWKDGKTIKSVDPQTLEYIEPQAQRLPGLDKIKNAGDLSERLRALFLDGGRAGAFFRDTTLQLLHYSAQRIREISDNPADIDRAMRWGFGWEMGPFEIWDTLGFVFVLESMRSEDLEPPEWINAMVEVGCESFYKTPNHHRSVYSPLVGYYVDDPYPPDQIPLEVIHPSKECELWSSDAAALLTLGDGVALYEFRSKANTLGRAVMEGLREAIERVESDASIKGLIVANNGKNFSVGANLVEMASAIGTEAHDELGAYLKEFQDTVQRVRYAGKPVVVSVHQRVLGGACELVMACPHPVAAAESYIGLVELGVGLIPAGTGSARLAAFASDRAPERHPSQVQAWLWKFFESVAMAAVSTSAPDAQRLGFLMPNARIVMNDERRIHVAREEVIRLSSEGYLPPPAAKQITVLGRPTAAAFAVSIHQYLEGHFISEYDAYLANRLAYVMTGGELSGPQEVPEDYLLDLERQVFLDLLQEDKTRERIEHMLKTKKPLRN